MQEPTPIALSFLYGGAKKVQGEADVTKNQEILITEQMEAVEAGEFREIVKEEVNSHIKRGGKWVGIFLIFIHNLIRLSTQVGLFLDQLRNQGGH